MAVGGWMLREFIYHTVYLKLNITLKAPFNDKVHIRATSHLGEFLTMGFRSGKLDRGYPGVLNPI